MAPRTFYLLLGLLLAVMPLRAAAPPKKLLVVSVTTGYRHGSIPTLKKMLARLSQSSGEFTLDYLDQPAGKPPDLKKPFTPEQQAVHDAAMKQWEETQLKPALARLAPAQLAAYDGVVFASTTGDLPIPDPAGFLKWIEAGHAFIGLHAASDAFHHWPAYIQMLGGEFDHHGAQVGVSVTVADPHHPATVGLPQPWAIAQEEIYQFKNYDPARVHELLFFDRDPYKGTPGHFPLAWCKDFGQGRVFYTALGHREDLIDPDPALPGRKNTVATAQAYDAHVLGGIEWALRLKR